MINGKNCPAENVTAVFAVFRAAGLFPENRNPKTKYKKGENKMEVLLIIACVLVVLICLAIVGYILFRPAVPKQEIPPVEMRPEEEDASEEDAGGDENADDVTEEQDSDVTEGEKAAEVSAEDENAPDDGDAEEITAADEKAETAEDEVTVLKNDGAVAEDAPDDGIKNIEE